MIRKLRLRLPRFKKSIPTASISESPARRAISPRRPESLSPSRRKPTTAASKRDRKSHSLMVLPRMVDPGSSITSVRLAPSRPSSIAKDLSPWKRSSMPTLETSPEKIRRSPAANRSSGVTGVSNRPARTNSTRNKSPRSRSPFSAIVLPINCEFSSTTISIKNSLIRISG